MNIHNRPGRIWFDRTTLLRFEPSLDEAAVIQFVTERKIVELTSVRFVPRNLQLCLIRTFSGKKILFVKNFARIENTILHSINSVSTSDYCLDMTRHFHHFQLFSIRDRVKTSIFLFREIKGMDFRTKSISKSISY